MDYKTLKYQPGAIARVILNRPEKLNAQSWTMLNEMDHAFHAAVNNPEVHVIILSGEGRAFSAGHDLDSNEQVADHTKRTEPLTPFERSALNWDIYVASHLRWRDLPKPTIAMVHGYCIFGGWMIASAMDFIFASEDALFTPTYGDYFTTSWDLGARKAKEILYENRFMTAREAMTWGFVNRVYPAADLEKETLAYAARVIETGQFYTRTVKFAINQTMDMMGFSTSVRAVGEYFLRGTDSTSSPGRQTAGTPQEGRFRNLTGRVMKYLQEDGKKPHPHGLPPE
ncbi:MAG: enoyl-CoA hydratase-related protein [Dehalococcoidia bacterium]|nr:enoyl-CoA hydratase-related protein [Dehalococcoidia bacterium]